jgi:hypothetical protein
MLITTTTPVIYLLNETRDKGTVTMLELDESIITGRPAAIIFAGTGTHNIEIIKGAIMDKLASKKLLINSAEILEKLGGSAHNKRTVNIDHKLSTFLQIAHRERRAIVLEFTANEVQRRPVAVLVVAVHKHVVELVKEWLVPVLKSTEVLNDINLVDSKGRLN